MKCDDLLSDAALADAPRALSARYTPHVYRSIDSTNTEAKRRAASGEQYALIVAESQTSGRGRMGRSFYSPDGSGVYFSILHTFSAPIANAVSITSAAAVAVMRAVRRVCGKQTDIKWVNDLCLDGKKVCGILAESVLDPMHPATCAVVVGIGINLREADFPPALASIAGTLGDERVRRRDLIAAVIEELVPFLDDPNSRAWLDDYRTHSCVIGREITWTHAGETYFGRAEDIDGDGALLVLRADGARERLSTGEISLRLV